MKTQTTRFCFLPSAAAAVAAASAIAIAPFVAVAVQCSRCRRHHSSFATAKLSLTLDPMATAQKNDNHPFFTSSNLDKSICFYVF